MRERLTAYVDLLFAGNPEAEDVKQEILQNTLDKYDDLVAGGRSPEAAYSLAISGIGDLSELLNGNAPMAEPVKKVYGESREEKNKRKLMQAVAVGLYIICPIPLFFFHSKVGLCLLLLLVAAATILMVFSRKEKGSGENGPDGDPRMTARQKLKKSIRSTVDTVGLCIYFLLSILTGAWHLTWLIFLITEAVNGLIMAIMDLKETE